MNLLVEKQAIRAGLGYLDEKELPQATHADPPDFFDNSFVQNLQQSGFFQSIGFVRGR